MNINSSHGADAHVSVQRIRQRNRRDGLADFPDDSYLEGLRETDTDDESSSLTSQTLNADGTPKRPMNAFMIFARRRRPQVSAANQTMRTGDISKILSKEWNAMQSVEKQFYQDQAKHLKDAFNMRYPDYVYRRRPNNSRRKRKPDGGGARQVDRMVSLDTSDDVLGLVDVGESFTDAEDSHEDHPDSLELRHSSYSDPRKFSLSHARSFSYAYPGMNHSHRSNGTREGASLYGQNTFGVPCSPQSNSVGPPHAHSQPDSHRSHSYSGPLFASQSQYSHETYETPAMAWPQGIGHDRPEAQKQHFPTSANHLTGPESTMVSSRPAPNAAFSSEYVLPTLNSPFYPSQISSQSYVSYSTGSSHPQSPFSTGIVLPTSSPKTEHENYAYSSASSCSPASVASGQEAPPPYSRRNNNPYISHFHPSSHHSLPNSGLSTPQAYWSGE